MLRENNPNNLNIQMQDMEKRIARSVELFKSGYNCSQSVVAAFASLYGFTEEQALRMAASFGGGIGRMRQTVLENLRQDTKWQTCKEKGVYFAYHYRSTRTGETVMVIVLEPSDYR